MNQNEVRSKLELEEARVVIPIDEIVALVSGIFENIGCSAEVSREVAEHLADSNLCGMESHGLMRTLQYADQFESAQGFIVGGHLPFALQHMNRYCGLTVGCR